ncbi:hypothetical protein FWF89_01990 [Candidatus Saccharibacteria bacterium]|nr:hypothetical protein [Candidatus Saccharibacteria bacterium]
MKKFLAFIVCLAACLIIAPSAHAAQISEDQAGIISMTCGSIQLQLKNLQKADSRIRVYLGSKYEFVLTNLMTNLNLRLVKNNLASSPLSASQTTFNSEREFFKTTFTDYAKSLDTLIATDCKSNPYNFYDHLEITRSKREIVRQSYLRLKDVLADHRAVVVNFRDSL